jgi:hypothetical protein
MRLSVTIASSEPTARRSQMARWVDLCGSSTGARPSRRGLPASAPRSPVRRVELAGPAAEGANRAVAVAEDGDGPVGLGMSRMNWRSISAMKARRGLGGVGVR